MWKSNRLKFLIYFTALVTIGSGGYYIIGGKDWSVVDSIYMTIITLSTVGFGEIHPLGEMGKIWTILVIIFGVSGVAVMISQIGVDILEFKNYRSRAMLKKIAKMHNHYIICGFGRMGAVIAGELHKKGIPFVIIEINEHKIHTIEQLNYCFIQDDATLDETLISVVIKEAKGIVVVLDNDQDNLFVTMSARSLNPDAYIISRCAKHDTEKKLKRAGANKVVNPYITGGHRMAELLTSPYIEDSVTIVTPEQQDIDIAIEEISISHIRGFNNKLIKDCRLREDYQLLIVGIVDGQGNTTLNPGSDVMLYDRHKILLIGSKENLSLFKSNVLSDV